MKSNSFKPYRTVEVKNVFCYNWEIATKDRAYKKTFQYGVRKNLIYLKYNRNINLDSGNMLLELSNKLLVFLIDLDNGAFSMI